MSLFITEINKHKNKTDKMVKRLEVIPNIRDIDFPDNLMNQVPENFWTDLGTIGGGNHFAELQEVDAVYAVEQFHNLNLNKDTVLAHGAGRKWERTVCKARLESKYTKESIKTTQYKSKIIYRDSRLLFEEAPEAYKNIDWVIQSFVELGLLKIIATFKPMITYKG